MLHIHNINSTGNGLFGISFSLLKVQLAYITTRKSWNSDRILETEKYEIRL